MKEKLQREIARNFVGIIYPESCPENYEEMLLAEEFNVAFSPIHSPDGDNKKKHVHLVLSFSGPKDLDDLDNYMRTKYKGTSLFKCADLRKSLRYLTHLDNPEKEQFRQEAKSNWDIRKYVSNEVYIQDILSVIEQYDLFSFADLTRWFAHDFNALEKISKNAYFFNKYMEMRKS